MGSWRRLTGLVVAAALLIVAPSAAALPEQPSESAWVANGDVNAIAQQGDTTFIGGDFTYVGPRVGQAISLSATDGSRQAFPEFAGGSVLAIEPDGSGGWYVGGSFTHAGGQARARLVHVLAGGSVDPGFNPNPNQSVEALALDSANGRLYVGGFFTQIGGTTRNHLARILTATGAVDPAWNPNITGSTVRALELHPDQTNYAYLWAGGSFNHVGAVTRNNFAEIYTNGPSTGTATGVYSGGTDSYVNDIEFEGDSIYIAGSFTTVFGTARHGIASLNFLAPALNMSWDPNITRSGSIGIVWQIDVSATGLIHTAGSFDAVGGATHNGIAAIGDVPSGSDNATSWDPGLSGSLLTFQREATSVAVDGSTVYVGGNFTTIGGQSRNGLAALSASTGNATAWDPNVSAEPRDLAVSGSTVIAGGDFTAAGGVRRANLAALDASGAATSWNPGTSGEVNALAAAPGNGPIYVGGNFAQLGGQTRSNIGAVDAAGNVTGWDPNASSDIHALAVSPDAQTVYAGGQFGTIGGQTRDYLAALDAGNGSARGWNPAPDANVLVIRPRADGTRIFVGGDFSNFGGTTPRNYIAQLDPGSNTPLDWSPNLDGRVWTIALSPDESSVYFGGEFQMVGTDTRNRVAAVDAGSGALKPFNPNSDSTVRALAFSEDGATIFAGGEFQPQESIGGAGRGGLAELDAATGAATGWNPNTDDDVYALTRVGPDLQVGGNFRRVGSGAVSGFARFVGPRPPQSDPGQQNPAAPSGPATPSAPPADTTAPLLSALSLTNKTFAVGPKPTALSAAKRRVKKGTTLRWTLSEAATTRIQIQQERRGIKVGKRCRVAKPGAKVPRKRRCTALQAKGTLRRAAKQGRNSTAFSGRIGRRALKPGTYRAVFTATDAAGNRSAPKRLGFKIVRAPR